MPPAKRQRNYAAEYRQRIAAARERAAREGSPLDLSKARGHISRDHERQVTRVYKLSDDNRKRLHETQRTWPSKRDIRAYAKAHGWDVQENKLLDQKTSMDAYAIGNPLPGRVNYGGQDDQAPKEFFFYHAGKAI